MFARETFHTTCFPFGLLMKSHLCLQDFSPLATRLQATGLLCFALLLEGSSLGSLAARPSLSSALGLRAYFRGDTQYGCRLSWLHVSSLSSWDQVVRARLSLPCRKRDLPAAGLFGPHRSLGSLGHTQHPSIMRSWLLAMTEHCLWRLGLLCSAGRGEKLGASGRPLEHGLAAEQRRLSHGAGSI